MRRSSVKTFYACNCCSGAYAIVFNVVLFVEYISFHLFQLLIYVCLFVYLFVCQDGSTPLHEASSGGRMEVVRLLLDRGAHIQAQTKVSESECASE